MFRIITVKLRQDTLMKEFKDFLDNIVFFIYQFDILVVSII